MIAATYVLQVHTHHKPGNLHLREEFLRETEENLTDLLPDGWWAEIHTVFVNHPWDEPTEEGATDD